jgi:hypothetical protein
MCLAAWCDSAFGVAFILSNILSLGSALGALEKHFTDVFAHRFGTARYPIRM